MATVSHQLPKEVLVNSEMFGNALGEEAQTLQGPVRAIFLDGEGEMWCAYELADIFGVQVISLASTFFLGFTHE